MTDYSSSPILLAGMEEYDSRCFVDFEAFRSGYLGLPQTAQQSIHELGLEHAQQLAAALAAFLKNNGLTMLGDTNTFGGGAAAPATGRLGSLLKQLQEVEQLALQYKDAPIAEKQRIKQDVKTRMQSINEKFKAELTKFSPERAPGRRRSRLRSSRHVLKAAQNGSYAPLTGAPETRRMMKVMQGARYVGKGIVILDLGLRANNIYQAENKTRQTAMEFAGLSGSFSAGAIGTGIIAGLTLTPIGWVVAIVAIGATAVAADYVFKGAAEKVYDAAVNNPWETLPKVEIYP